MKAFRQVTFKLENRLVWSYTATLILTGCILMFRPLLAQQEKDVPEINVDVKKEYNEHGKLMGIDSVITWTWSGKSFSQSEFDSIWKAIGNPDLLLPETMEPYGFYGSPSGPPLHPFWFWNGEDSTARPFFEDLFGDGFRNRFYSPPHFRHPGGLNADSLIYSFHDFDRYRNDQKDEGIKDLEARIEEYLREHRQLIDKYFKDRPGEKEINPEATPNNHVPRPNPSAVKKMGRV